MAPTAAVRNGAVALDSRLQEELHSCCRVEEKKKKEVIKQHGQHDIIFVRTTCVSETVHSGDMGDLCCLLYTFLDLESFLSVRTWWGGTRGLGPPLSCLRQFSSPATYCSKMG